MAAFSSAQFSTGIAIWPKQWSIYNSIRYVRGESDQKQLCCGFVTLLRILPPDSLKLCLSFSCLSSIYSRVSPYPNIKRVQLNCGQNHCPCLSAHIVALLLWLLSSSSPSPTDWPKQREILIIFFIMDLRQEMLIFAFQSSERGNIRSFSRKS